MHGEIELKPTFNALSGKVIFLHYTKGSKPNTQLSKVVTRLHGEISEFFDNRVHMLITNRSDLPSRSEVVSTPSPGEHRSSPATLSSILQSPASQTLSHLSPLNSPFASQISPYTSTSPSSLTRKCSSQSSVGSTTLSRGQRMTLMTKNSNSADDIIEKALRRNLLVLTVKEFWRWFHDLPTEIQIYVDEIKSNSTEQDNKKLDLKIGVRSLRTPCFKILDVKNAERPMFVETTHFEPKMWPAEDFNLVGDSQAKKSTATCGRKGKEGRKIAAITLQSRWKKKLSRIAEKQRKPVRINMCEGCHVSYRKLDKHLRTEAHQKYAENSDDNFKTVDELLKKLPTFQQVIQIAQKRLNGRRTDSGNAESLIEESEGDLSTSLPRHRSSSAHSPARAESCSQSKPSPVQKRSSHGEISANNVKLDNQENTSHEIQTKDEESKNIGTGGGISRRWAEVLAANSFEEDGPSLNNQLSSGKVKERRQEIDDNEASVDIEDIKSASEPAQQTSDVHRSSVRVDGEEGAVEENRTALKDIVHQLLDGEIIERQPENVEKLYTNSADIEIASKDHQPMGEKLVQRRCKVTEKENTAEIVSNEIASKEEDARISDNYQRSGRQLRKRKQKVGHTESSVEAAISKVEDTRVNENRHSLDGSIRKRRQETVEKESSMESIDRRSETASTGENKTMNENSVSGKQREQSQEMVEESQCDSGQCRQNGRVQIEEHKGKDNHPPLGGKIKNRRPEVDEDFNDECVTQTSDAERYIGANMDTRDDERKENVIVLDEANISSQDQEKQFNDGEISSSGGRRQSKKKLTTDERLSSAIVRAEEYKMNQAARDGDSTPKEDDRTDDHASIDAERTEECIQSDGETNVQETVCAEKHISFDAETAGGCTLNEIDRTSEHVSIDAEKTEECMQSEEESISKEAVWAAQHISYETEIAGGYAVNEVDSIEECASVDAEITEECILNDVEKTEEHISTKCVTTEVDATCEAEPAEEHTFNVTGRSDQHKSHEAGITKELESDDAEKTEECILNETDGCKSNEVEKFAVHISTKITAADVRSTSETDTIIDPLTSQTTGRSNEGACELTSENGRMEKLVDSSGLQTGEESEKSTADQKKVKRKRRPRPFVKMESPIRRQASLKAMENMKRIKTKDAKKSKEGQSNKKNEEKENMIKAMEEVMNGSLMTSTPRVSLYVSGIQSQAEESSMDDLSSQPETVGTVTSQETESESTSYQQSTSQTGEASIRHDPVQFSPLSAASSSQNRLSTEVSTILQRLSYAGERSPEHEVNVESTPENQLVPNLYLSSLVLRPTVEASLELQNLASPKLVTSNVLSAVNRTPQPGTPTLLGSPFKSNRRQTLVGRVYATPSPRRRTSTRLFTRMGGVTRTSEEIRRERSPEMECRFISCVACQAFHLKPQEAENRKNRHLTDAATSSGSTVRFRPNQVCDRLSRFASVPIIKESHSLSRSNNETDSKVPGFVQQTFVKREPSPEQRKNPVRREQSPELERRFAVCSSCGGFHLKSSYVDVGEQRQSPIERERSPELECKFNDEAIELKVEPAVINHSPVLNLPDNDLPTPPRIPLHGRTFSPRTVSSPLSPPSVKNPIQRKEVKMPILNLCSKENMKMILDSTEKIVEEEIGKASSLDESSTTQVKRRNKRNPIRRCQGSEAVNNAGMNESENMVKDETESSVVSKIDTRHDDLPLEVKSQRQLRERLSTSKEEVIFDYNSSKTTSNKDATTDAVHRQLRERRDISSNKCSRDQSSSKTVSNIDTPAETVHRQLRERRDIPTKEDQNQKSSQFATKKDDASFERVHRQLRERRKISYSDNNQDNQKSSQIASEEDASGETVHRQLGERCSISKEEENSHQKSNENGNYQYSYKITSKPEAASFVAVTGRQLRPRRSSPLTERENVTPDTETQKNVLRKRAAAPIISDNADKQDDLARTIPSRHLREGSSSKNFEDEENFRVEYTGRRGKRSSLKDGQEKHDDQRNVPVLRDRTTLSSITKSECLDDQAKSEKRVLRDREKWHKNYNEYDDFDYENWLNESMEECSKRSPVVSIGRLSRSYDAEFSASPDFSSTNFRPLGKIRNSGNNEKEQSKPRMVLRNRDQFSYNEDDDERFLEEALALSPVVSLERLKKGMTAREHEGIYSPFSANKENVGCRSVGGKSAERGRMILRSKENIERLNFDEEDNEMSVDESIEEEPLRRTRFTSIDRLSMANSPSSTARQPQSSGSRKILKTISRSMIRESPTKVDYQLMVTGRKPIKRLFSPSSGPRRKNKK